MLEEALREPLAPLERAREEYTLGGCRHARQDYDSAFQAYRRANEALTLDYDLAAHARWVDEELEAFTTSRVEGYARSDREDERPVFIVGMPRGGTSLAEQILERHPQVHAAGELSAMADAQSALPGLLRVPCA